MVVAHKGNATDLLIDVPKAPVYMTDEAKKHYKKMGLILAKNNLLKEKFLSALELYSESMAQWEFAVSQIKKKNKDKFGSGYIQTYQSKAQNVSVEVTLKDKAEDSLIKCFKIFGLDPKSEKELKSTTDPNQLDAFEQLMAKKNA